MEKKTKVSRISIVKPEKGRAVEEHLLRMAQTGQLPGKVDEKQLILLLERISAQEQEQEKKIKVFFFSFIFSFTFSSINAKKNN